MGRKFHLQISKVIPTLQFCRPKDPSNLPTNPVPSSPHPPSIKRHVSSALSPKPTPPYSPRTVSPPEAFQWLEEEKWHVLDNVRHVAPRHKIYNSSGDEMKNRVHRNSVCSSGSFSKESSLESDKKKRRVRREKLEVKMTWRSSVSSAEGESPARLSVFKKLIPCAVEGKVKESFAVFKKSKDPYEDFKKSMVEMILEKQMFDDTELEQLLLCFLSLNSRLYHGLIVEAFTEIWKAMFCTFSTDHHL